MAKNPTCTAKGWNKYETCSRCSYTTYAEKKALGHSWKDYKVNATYDKAGKSYKQCTRTNCGAKKDEKTIARLTLVKVTGITATPAETSIKFTWKNVSGAKKYEIQYSTDGKKWKKTTSNKNTVIIKGLKAGTNCKIKVRALRDSYKGAFSALFTAGTKPVKVTLSSVKSPKAKQMKVTWKKVSGANGYVIEYSTAKNFKKKSAD